MLEAFSGGLAALYGEVSSSSLPYFCNCQLRQERLKSDDVALCKHSISEQVCGLCFSVLKNLREKNA